MLTIQMSKEVKERALNEEGQLKGKAGCDLWVTYPWNFHIPWKSFTLYRHTSEILWIWFQTTTQ